MDNSIGSVCGFPIRRSVFGVLLSFFILNIKSIPAMETTEPNPPVIYCLRPFTGPVDESPKDFQSISKAAETQAIRVSAETARTHRMNKPSYVNLVFENGRKEDVFFEHTADESDFFLQLVDSEHKVVPMSDKGRVWLGSSLYAHLLSAKLTLHPGQSIVRKYDLNEYFRITHPGAYRLTIVKTTDGTSSYPFAGKELEVEIDALTFNFVE